MPVFNAAQSLASAINVGDLITLFAATDTLTAPANSIVFTLASPGPRTIGNIQFQIHFASAPTAVVKIFGSNQAPTSAGPDANAVLLWTSTNLQNDNFIANDALLFHWAELVSQSAGGALTVTAHAQ